MSSNRVITVVCVLAVVIVAVTFLGAAKMSGDDAPEKAPKVLSPVKNGSKGVVVYGTVDVDDGLIPVFPENFPQPSTVKKVLVKEGQDVRAGQELIEFDSELAEIRVREARHGHGKALAAQARAQALLEQAAMAETAQPFAVEVQRLAIKAKEADVRAAEVELKDKKDRLFKSAKVEMDPEIVTAERRLEGAQRALDSEKKKLEIIERFDAVSKKKAEAAAALDEAKQAVAIQQAQLDAALYGKRLMTLTARTDGKIVRSMVTPGMSFGPQTRQPAFYIQPRGAVIVRAEVDQEWASRVAAGQDAVIEDDANPNLKWTGKVTRLADSFLPKRSNNSLPEGLALNETRVLECIVTLEGGDSRYPVRVGQRVKVKIGVE